MTDSGVGAPRCAAVVEPAAMASARTDQRLMRVMRAMVAPPGTCVAPTKYVRALFIAWVALALLLLILGGLRTQAQNASRRAMAAPTRLSGVDAPEVRPTTTGPFEGSQAL